MMMPVMHISKVDSSDAAIMDQMNLASEPYSSSF